MLKAIKSISQKQKQKQKQKQNEKQNAPTRPCIHRSHWYELDSPTPTPTPTANRRPTGEEPFERPTTSCTTEGLTTLTPVPDTEACSLCKEQKRAERVYRLKLIAGLGLPFLLSSLDLTIVATATSEIASRFDQFSELNWIITAFSLTSTTFIPIFGQLSDVFGRHVVLQVALLFMLVGSVLCAAAQTWGMLLLGRALQGTGSAGIGNLIMIILADRVSLKENARNKSFFTLVGGVGYAVGPIVGGSNWRYCFVVPIPIAVFSHIMIFLLLRNDLVEGTMFKKGSRSSSILPALATVDIGGSLLFIFGVGLLILAATWGGATYSWSSSQVLAPLILGVICFVAFFVYEYLLEPGRLLARIFPRHVAMLPYSLFERRDTIWLAFLNFSTGAASYSIFYFISIYYTVVAGYSTSKAGLELLYYIPGLGGGVYLAVYMCNAFPRQTFFPLNIGAILSTIGLALVSYAISAQKTSILSGMLAITGTGVGLRMMPSSLHTAGVWPERLAPAMSLMQVALPFGGTLGLTIMTSVFNNKFGNSEALKGLEGVDSTLNVHDTNSLSFLDDLPPAVKESVQLAGKNAIMWAFISILPIMGVSLVAALVMGNVWVNMTKRNGDDDDDGRESVGGGDEGRSEVIHVPYLWALYKGSINTHRRISKPIQRITT
ncbi:MFS multidrug transporter [Aspergillus heteromorphus CBS 117.55]|uniref:MFS multidrug transporter n=1 Tax=Aspergillus heteromorphus CBS 117.55 TaxID=1448321 RepID=A0A317W8A0_9EURO|nr:MFS multidrug transporter [Aspergillus heteromorphus CBS 117.55]PWY82834.1 MFS multidrug transporter [Aspergillus heteromorphus CBS 117.55]